MKLRSSKKKESGKSVQNHREETRTNDDDLNEYDVISFPPVDEPI
ncbi:MAG: hypothetical protein ACFFD4_26395 [Candidatus Odinarchaeota archaeon]